MEQRRYLSLWASAGLCMLSLLAASCTSVEVPDKPDGGTSGTGGAGGSSTTASSSAGNTGGGGAGGGGGGDGGDGGMVMCTPGPLTGDIPCNVFEVIHRTCHACHTDPPLSGAPFPLLSYEDTQQTYFMDIRRYQRMNQVIREGGSPRMPLGSKLNDADLKILGDWLDQCAPPTADGKGCECPGKGCK